MTDTGLARGVERNKPDLELLRVYIGTNVIDGLGPGENRAHLGLDAHVGGKNLACSEGGELIRAREVAHEGAHRRAGAGQGTDNGLARLPGSTGHKDHRRSTIVSRIRSYPLGLYWQRAREAKYRAISSLPGRRTVSPFRS